MNQKSTTLTVNGLTFRDLNKNGRLDPYEDPRRPIEERVEDLLKQMTLEEKLGQINQYSVDDPTGPGKKHGAFVELAQQGKVGSLFNLVGPRVNELQRVAMEQSRLKIPILFGLDVIHGYRTIFPTPLALSATWDPALIEKTARVAAIEASAAGLRWTFSPMVDIARDARWGRIVEGAGEDPRRLRLQRVVLGEVIGSEHEQHDDQSHPER